MRSMLALTALALASAASAQTTWYVDINGTPPGSGTVADPYTSINYAVSQPSTISGDVVEVAPGTYQELIFILAKGVHVKSSGGPSVTIVDAAGAGSPVAVLGTDGTMTIIEGLTLTNGVGTGTAGPQGGGLFASSSLLRISDCIIENNEAKVGGGVFLRNCIAEVLQSTIRNNETYPFGPGLPHGGGVYVGGGIVSIVNSTVDDNRAGNLSVPGLGGGVYAANGTLNASNSTFRDNFSEYAGGGIYALQGTIEGCWIEGNRAWQGGGVYGAAGLFIRDTTIHDNDAISATGGGNSGGGVYGPATLDKCVLTNNRAWGTGGGAHSAVLIDCLVESNWASVDWQSPGPVGGGAYGGTLLNCILSKNTAIGDGSTFTYQAGGAIFSDLTNCKVFRNIAFGPAATGGGLTRCNASFTEVYDNYSAGAGGGIVGGTTDHCTVFGNRAKLGGGGILDTGFPAILVTNSIVWNNGQEIRLAPNSTATITYCDVKGGFPGTGNINLDPQFWNEAARDFHLLPTSPCIDAGDPLSPLDPDGSLPDMGAFPFDPNYNG